MIRCLVFCCVALAAGANAEDVYNVTAAAAWQTHAPEGSGARFRTDDASRSVAEALVIDLPEGAPQDFYQYFLQFPDLEQGSLYEFTGWVKVENQAGGVGAMLSLGAFNEAGERFLAFDSQRLLNDTDWTFLECLVFASPDIKAIAPALLLHGTSGTAWFDDIRLTRLVRLEGAGPSAAVTARLAATPFPGEFLGFGLEDDLFLFTEENLRHGVDEADIELRNARIAELDPAVIATLVWWDAFNPSRDLETLVTDSEQMRALYRTLEPHQRAGRAVILADTHWGWTPEQFPYSERNLEKGVRFYADFLTHLVKDKGFTCLRYASVSGEIDLRFEEMGGSFATYVEANRLLRKHLDAAGLADVHLIGDKVTGVSWFERVVKETDPYVGLYTTHEYPDITQYPIIQTRLERMMQVIHEESAPVARTPRGPVRKPAFLWEIGYFDRAAGDSDNSHQAVRRFDYGLLCAHTALTSLNLGFAGGSIWCLHSMYYPGQNFMDFGFWEFKHEDWRIRPFYYGFGLLMRFARPGMRPVPVTASPRYRDVTIAAVEGENGHRTVFLLNLSGNVVPVTLEGLAKRDYEVYAYTEDRIPEPGGEDYGRIDALRTGDTWSPGDDAFKLPPRSLVALR